MNYVDVLKKEYKDAGQRPLQMTVDGRKLIIPYIYSLEEDKERIRQAFLRDYTDIKAETPEKTARLRFAKYRRAVRTVAHINKLDPQADMIVSVSQKSVAQRQKQEAQLVAKKIKDKSKRAAYTVGRFLAHNARALGHKIKTATPEQLKSAVRKTLVGAGLVGALVIGHKMHSPAPVQDAETNKTEQLAPKKSTPHQTFPKVKFSNMFKNQPQLEDKYGNLKMLDNCSDEISTVLAALEGFSAEAFDDGTGTQTIGYGTTFYIDSERRRAPVKEGDKLSQEDAMLQKQRYIADVMRPIIAENVTRKLNKNEMIATIGLGFCIGPAGLKNSTYLQYLNENKSKYETSCAATLWNKQKGVPKRVYFLMALKDGYLKTSDFLDIGWKGGENLYKFGLEDLYECRKDKNGDYVKDGRHACPITNSKKFYSKIKFRDAHELIKELKDSCTTPVREILPTDLARRVEKNDKTVMFAYNTKEQNQH